MFKSLALTLLLGCAALLFAADVNGKYRGSIEAPDGTHVLVFDLKTSGAVLTGTVNDAAPANPNSAGRQIQEGKVQGDAITFSWITDYQGSPIKLICKGQIAGDELKLNMGTDDGSWSTDLTAKKTN